MPKIDLNTGEFKTFFGHSSDYSKPRLNESGQLSVRNAPPFKIELRCRASPHQFRLGRMAKHTDDRAPWALRDIRELSGMFLVSEPNIV